MVPIGFSLIVSAAAVDVLAPDDRLRVVFLGFSLIVVSMGGKMISDFRMERTQRQAAAWELLKDSADAGLEHHRQATAESHYSAIMPHPAQTRRRSWVSTLASWAVSHVGNGRNHSRDI
ncbi:hypothetical protein [Phytoactinopolyspora halophila]|uniref:hypothetical protein n=1 Tax=Phytoactinopolyspora halophila TaxID=1981511 RepID=UPI000F4E2E7B|nr:hypothetical protein [Phytoactinopolyspora halophila]